MSNGDTATVKHVAGPDGKPASPCDALADAMAVSEDRKPGSAKQIAYTLGGTDALCECNRCGARGMLEQVGEAHVLDCSAGRPYLFESTSYELVTESAPPSSRKLTWESMLPRLAAVGLADFPEPVPCGHDVYKLMGPDGEWAGGDFVSIDHALDYAAERFGATGTVVEVDVKRPLRAVVDADAVLDDVLEGILDDTGSEQYETLFDGVREAELKELSNRLTACLDAWMADCGYAVDGLWYGMCPRRYRRAFDGMWVEVDAEVPR